MIKVTAYTNPISIHALRKESDTRQIATSRSVHYFNPRSP